MRYEGCGVAHVAGATSHTLTICVTAAAVYCPPQDKHNFGGSMDAYAPTYVVAAEVAEPMQPLPDLVVDAEVVTTDNVITIDVDGVVTSQVVVRD